MSHNGANINLKIGMKATGNFSNFNKTMKNATSGVKTFTSKMGAAKKAVVALGTAFAGLTVVHTIVEDFKAISGLEFTNFAGLVEQSIEVSKNFADAEAKLKALLKNTKSITDPAGAATRLINQTATLESSGVVAQEVLESGLQQLSTFQLSEDSLTQLSTGMADLLAQQYGVDATQENAVSVANLIGKGMSGMTGALTRVGIVMDEQEKQLIQNGDEQTRLNTMVQVLSKNVGGVNQYLAENTAAGKEANFQYQIAAYMREWGDKFSEMRIKILDTIRPYLPILKRIMDAVISVIGNVITGVGTWIDQHGEDISAFLEGIAVKIENFASKITPSTIENWVTSLFEKLDSIIKLVEKIIIGLALTKIGGGINNFITGGRLRAQLPKNLWGEAGLNALSDSQLLTFQNLNLLRSGSVSAAAGAKMGKYFPFLFGGAGAARGFTQYTSAIGPGVAGGLTGMGSAQVTIWPKLLSVLTKIGSFLNVFTISAGIAFIAAGLNKFIKDQFGSGEGLGEWLAGLLVKAVSFLYNLLLDFFDANSLPELLINVFKNAIEFFFQTLPEVLWGFVKTIALALYDAFTGKNTSGLFGENSSEKGGVSIGSIHQNALGTPYSHGTTTINERGGEIMRLPSGTTIIPADKSAALLNGTGGITVNLNIQGNVLGNEQYMNETCEYLVRQMKLALVAG